MIIRRKPIGFQNLRKPQSLGMTLLKNSVARIQALTVRRAAQTDEALDWGEGEIPDDIYDEAEIVDEGEAYDDRVSSAIQSAEAMSTPRREPARPRRARRSTASDTAAPPAQAAPLRRLALSETDYMPTDLSAIMAGHRKLGHIPDKPVSIFNLPSSTAAVAESSNVQRSEAEAPPPRTRRRGQIIDVIPPKKGLPFADDEEPSSPLGAPILDGRAASQSTYREAAHGETTERENVGRATPAMPPAVYREVADDGDSTVLPPLADAPNFPVARAIDGAQTLTDFDNTALQAAIARSESRSELTSTTPSGTDRRANTSMPGPSPVRRSPDSQPTTIPDLPAAFGRAPADTSSASTESGDFDHADDEPGTARRPTPAPDVSHSVGNAALPVHRTFEPPFTLESDPAARVAAAIARAESRSVDAIQDSDVEVDPFDAPDTADFPRPAPSLDAPTPAVSTVQATRADAPNLPAPTFANDAALQAAIARAESPIDQPSFDRPSKRTGRIQNTMAVGDNPTSRTVQPTQADSPDRPSLPDNARAVTIAAAIARAESPSSQPSFDLPTERTGRIQNTMAVGDNPTARTVQPTQADSPDMPSLPDHAQAATIAAAIARAESPIDPSPTTNANRVDQARPPAARVVQPTRTNTPPPDTFPELDTPPSSTAAIARADNFSGSGMRGAEQGNSVGRFEASSTPRASESAASVQPMRINNPELSAFSNKHDDSSDSAVAAAIARAERPLLSGFDNGGNSSVAASDSFTPDATSPAGSVQPMRTQPSAPNAPADTVRDAALQAAIARAERSADPTPATPDKQGRATRATSNQISTPTVQATRAESGAPNPSSASNRPDYGDFTTNDAAVEAAIARAESRPDTMVSTNASSDNSATHSNLRMPTEATPTSLTAPALNAPSRSVQSTRVDMPSSESEATTFAAPYAADDPHYAAFQNAIAKAEGQPMPEPTAASQDRSTRGRTRGTAAQPALTPVQRVPSLEEDAAAFASSEQSIDLGDALGVSDRANRRESTPRASSAVQRSYSSDATPPSDTEVDLLRLLGKSSDTPIKRSVSQPLQPLQATPVSGKGDSAVARVQRASTSSSADTPSASSQNADFGRNSAQNVDQPSNDSNAQKEDDPVEIERMAQEVYRILRQRLKMERERSQGRIR